MRENEIRVWIIRYADGRLRSCWGTYEQAKQAAEDNKKESESYEIIK